MWNFWGFFGNFGGFWEIFGNSLEFLGDFFWIFLILLKFFGDSMGILWEFFGNSLGILWEFFGDSLRILWEFFGNSLEILWEFFRNSSGIIGKYFGNYLVFFWNSFLNGWLIIILICWMRMFSKIRWPQNLYKILWGFWSELQPFRWLWNSSSRILTKSAEYWFF